MNIHRSPNPFSSGEEPDWVHITSSVPRNSDKNAENAVIRQKDELLNISGHSERPQDTVRDIKTPPPIPRKPKTLISKESRPNTIMEGVRSGRDMEQNPQNMPQSPGVVYPHDGQGARTTANGGRNTTDLLNDDVDEGINWKPLLPQ